MGRGIDAASQTGYDCHSSSSKIGRDHPGSLTSMRSGTPGADNTHRGKVCGCEISADEEDRRPTRNLG
jgi:hypothetical protein